MNVHFAAPRLPELPGEEEEEEEEEEEVEEEAKVVIQATRRRDRKEWRADGRTKQ